MAGKTRKKPLEGNMINEGSEEELKKIQSEIDSSIPAVDGSPIEKDRVPLKGPKPSIKEPTSIDEFKRRIQVWWYQFCPAFKDNTLLALNYKRIYFSLKTELIDNHIQYLDAYEPWQHIKNQVLSMQYDPSKDIIRIKYIGEYLWAIYPDICAFLDDPNVATKLSEPTRPIGPSKPIKDPRKDYELDSDIHGII